MNHETDTPSASPAVSAQNLTRRAALTFGVSLVRIVARSAVQVAVTPFIISGVGVESFGVWAMIQRMGVYLSLVDFRSAGASKILLSVRQHASGPDSANELRRIVGAAVATWAAFLPLGLIFGVLLVYQSHQIITTSPDLEAMTRWAMAFFLVGLLGSRLFALPNNVLYSMNLGYRAVAVDLAVPFLSGALAILAVIGDLDVPGLALASVVVLAAEGISKHLFAKRHVPWYGVERPNRSDFCAFAKMSFWMQLTNIGSVLLLGADVLIVGKLLGATQAAVYFQTTFLARMTTEAVSILFNSGKAGIAGMCGRQELTRVTTLRKESQVLALSILLVAGAVMMALNRMFVEIWVGPDLYAGTASNRLIVASSLFVVLARNEAIVIDGLLAVRSKSVVMIGCGVAAVAMGTLFTPTWGTAGMAASTMVAHIAMYVLFVAIVRAKMRLSIAAAWLHIVKPLFITAVVLWVADRLSGFLSPATWLPLAALTAAIALAACAASWFLVLGPAERRLVLARVRRAAIAEGSGGH